MFGIYSCILGSIRTGNTCFPTNDDAVGDFLQDLEALDDSLDQLDLKFIIRKIESGETLFPVDNRNFLVLEMTKQNTLRKRTRRGTLTGRSCWIWTLGHVTSRGSRAPGERCCIGT
jgi:hypothetical protein